jgi:hypothetical protein
MNMNAGTARKNLKCCRKSTRVMKGFAVQSATPTSLRKCSPHFAQEPEKEGRQAPLPTLRRDTAEATVRGVGNSRKSDTNVDSKIAPASGYPGDEEEATEAYNFGTSRR